MAADGRHPFPPDLLSDGLEGLPPAFLGPNLEAGPNNSAPASSIRDVGPHFHINRANSITTNNKSAEPDVPNPVKFMTDSEQYAAFGRAFISRNLVGGFTSLPKREIDLLVLDLLHEQWKEREEIGENTPYEPIRSLAQDLCRRRAKTGHF